MCYQCRARSQWITAYHSAILILSGCPSLRLSLIVPSIITLTSFCGIFILVVQTAINMTNSKPTKSNSKPLIIPFISLFMVLNLSGMGFFQWFFAENRRKNSIDYVYTIGKDKTTNWLHPILHYILSYRSSPFILYISTSILFLFMNEERCLKKKQTLSDDLSKNNEENKKQHFHEYDNNDDNIDFEKSKAKPVDTNNQYCENRYQIKQVQKQNEYSLIGTFIALSVPLQHQGFFSIGLYVIFYIIIDFIFTEISKARNGIKFNFSQIFIYNININKVKTFLKRYGSLLKTDFIDTFFSPAIQKMIIFFFIASSVSLIQYRKTGMDVEWTHHELMWSENIKQGYFYPSIVQWYNNLGLFPFYALIIIWFLLDPIHIKFLLPSLPIFIIGNYFNFQTIPKFNFLFFYPTWALISCIFVPISLKNLSNICFDSNKKDENEEIQGVFLAFSILFVLSCTLSSVMGLHCQWNKKSVIWSISEENVADYIIHNTKKSDVFLTSESIFDPCSLLAGRTSFKTSSINLFTNNKVWFYYNNDVEKLRENPNLGILPMISFYLEHSRKDFDTHLKKDNMNESWSLCFRYESYNLYNRTLHEK